MSAPAQIGSPTTLATSSSTLVISSGFPITLHAGEVLVVESGGNAAAAPTGVADDAARAYTLLDGRAATVNGTAVSSSAWIYRNDTGADITVNSITVTWAAGVARRIGRVIKFDDLITSGTIKDASANAQAVAGGSAPQTGSISVTPVASTSVYVLLLATFNLVSTTTFVFTPGTGYTKIGSEAVAGTSTVRGQATEYKSMTSVAGTPIVPDWSNDTIAGWTGAAIILKRSTAVTTNKELDASQAQTPTAGRTVSKVLVS